jgi:flagellar biosynthesis/type III secretory pathway M-ring protein FliF/YscJ
MTAYTKIGISLIMSILLPYFVWASDKNSTPFSELDQVLQYRISAEMGRDNPEYHFEKDGDVFLPEILLLELKPQFLSRE